MERTLVQKQLDEIRMELEALLNQQSPVIDTRMAMDILQRLHELTTNGGFPQFTVEEVRYTDPLLSKHLNDLQDQVINIINTAKDVFNEQTDKFNIALEGFTKAVNDANALIEEATTSIDNLEGQVKEKMANISVHNHEVKKISFNFNYDVRNANIIADTVMTLPIVSKKKLNGTATMKVIQPASTMISSLKNTENLKDSELFRGSFIGRLIAPFDEIRWGDEYQVSNAFDDSSNTDFVLQTIGWDQASRVDLNVDLPTSSNANMITIDTNGDVNVDFRVGKDVVTTKPKQGLIIGSRQARSVNFRITNGTVEYPTYEVLRLRESESKEVASVLNFSESLEAMGLAESIFGPDQVSVNVGDNDIEIITKDSIPVVETIVDNISISEVVFGSSGIWTSKAITTETPIVSVEVRADTYIPDIDKETLKFSISFDNEKFYPVRNASGSINAFNSSYPTRIVLNGDNLIEEYKYIPELKGKQEELYLKVEMEASTSDKDSPVVYALELKIKTEEEAQ